MAADLNPYFPIIGIAISTAVMVKYGYRRTMLILYATVLMGFGCWFMSPNIYWFSTGLTLKCIADEGRQVVHIVYVTEIIESDLRGFTTVLVVFIRNIGGILGKYSTATFYPTFTMMGMCALWSFLCILLSVAVPETPAWLLLNEIRRLARRRFFWLYGRTMDSESKFDDLVRHTLAVEEKYERGTIGKILSKSFMKAMLIILLMCTVQRLQLYGFVTHYVSRRIYDHVLEKTKGDKKAAEDTSQSYNNINDLLRLLATAAVLIIVYKRRRRPIFLVSSACTSIVLFVLLISMHAHFSSIGILVLSFVYIVTENMGSGIIPYTLTAEYFPQQLRAYGSAFVSLYLSYSNRILSIRYLDMRTNHKAFWSFWAASTVSIIVLYFILPDSDKLTLPEVEDTIKFGPWIQTGDKRVEFAGRVDERNASKPAFKKQAVKKKAEDKKVKDEDEKLEEETEEIEDEYDKLEDIYEDVEEEMDMIEDEEEEVEEKEQQRPAKKK